MNRDAIQSVFPLTESQTTMLAHHLQAGDGDRGRIQMEIRLQGAVDPELLQQVIDHLVRMFPVLRTTIHWHNLRQPVQVVHKEGHCCLNVEDWTDLESARAENELAAYLQKDKEAALDVTSLPAFRMSLLRLPDNQNILVWTCHHMFLDGWSSMLVLEEMVRAYGILAKGDTLDPVQTAAFKEFADWLAARPEASAKRFWQDKFEEIVEVPSITNASASSGASLDRESFQIEAAGQDHLEALARECRVSPFTVLLGMWSIILSELLDNLVVVAGVSVSGRSGHLQNEETMAGMMANTIPMPIRIDPASTFRDFTEYLGKEIQRYQDFDYTSPRQIHEWTGLSARRPLFDTLFVFANQPFSKTAGGETGEFSISSMSGAFTSASPLNLSIWKWDSLMADIMLDPELVDPAVATVIRQRLEDFFQNPKALLSKSISELRKPSSVSRVGSSEATAPQMDLLAGGAPVSELENSIHDAWKSVFELDEIGTEVDFFQLGGNSLLATLMVTRLQKSLNKPIPIESLFTAPTIRAMADLLADANAPESSDENEALLITIREAPGSPKLPLILIHGLGGSTYQYHLLSKYMPEDQPILAIQSPKEAYEDLKLMTESYYEELMRLYPDGRFILGGYCFGAGIAFELLQMMRSRGIQTQPMLAIEFMFLNLVRYRPRYLFNLLREENPSRFYKRVSGRLVRVRNRVMRYFKTPEKGMRTRVEDYMRLPELQESDYDRIDSYFFLLKDYRPRSFDGDLTVIVSESDYSRRDKQVGWDRIVKGDLTVKVVQATHVRIMRDPGIKKVAVEVIAFLDRVNNLTRLE